MKENTIYSNNFIHTNILSTTNTYPTSHFSSLVYKKLYQVVERGNIAEAREGGLGLAWHGTSFKFSG